MKKVLGGASTVAGATVEVAVVEVSTLLSEVSLASSASRLSRRSPRTSSIMMFLQISTASELWLRALQISTGWGRKAVAALITVSLFTSKFISNETSEMTFQSLPGPVILSPLPAALKMF